MGRKNIFELINNNYDIKKHVVFVKKLFDNLDNCYFENWGYNSYNDDYFDMFCDISGHVFAHQNDDWLYDKETIIVFLELIYNINNSRYTQNLIEKNLCWNNDKAIILETDFHIKHLLNVLNYQIIEDKNVKYKFIFIPINEQARQVAEKIESDYISFKVIEYNHHSLKGNLGGKKSILKLMGDEFEKIRDDLQQKDSIKKDASNLGYLLNNYNIRHDNDNNQERLSKLTDEELENIYDMTYDLLLMALSFKDCYIYRKTIEELKDKMGDRKDRQDA